MRPPTGAEVTEIEEIKAEIQPMFSADAIRYGDLLFVSGCVPMDGEGALVGEGDLERQTRQVMENLDKVLRAAGTDFSNILKTTVFMTDIRRREVPDAIRGEYFSDRRPASTIVEVTALTAAGIEIEIEAIATVPSA
jgi:2-iminobutanoate/2-iminopropanoate deaminase